jgi:hypothetical protein
MTRPTSTSRLHHPSGDLLALADGTIPPAQSEEPAPERRNCWTCAYSGAAFDECNLGPIDEWCEALEWFGGHRLPDDTCEPDADGCPGWVRRPNADPT